MRTDPSALPAGTPAARGPATPTAPGSQRLPWADAAKGVCIVLVVLHHLVTKHYDLVVPDGPTGTVWLAVTDGLKPIRMPLFFVVSGMFAAAAVHRPWRDVARRRLATPYYLYAVWLVVHAVVFTYATVLPMNRTQTLAELGQDLLLASTQLWYLYALALYFVLAKLLLHLDARAVLVVAAAVSATTSLLPIEAANRESVLQHFVFFLVGVLAPSLPRRIAELRGGHVTGALAAGTLVATGAAVVLGLPQSATTLLVSVAGVPLAIRLVVSASTRPWFAALAGALGRRTLPIYVMHVPLLSLLHHVVVPLPEVPGAAGAVLLVVYPVAATAVITATCLLLHAILTRCGLGVLFRLPEIPGGRPKVPVGATLRA